MMQTPTRALLKFAAWCAQNNRPLFEEETTMTENDRGLADATAPDFVEQLEPVEGAADELDLELADISTEELLAQVERERQTEDTK